MSELISETWSALPTPKPGDGYSAAPVRNTNCWLFKDEEGSMGFLMSGVSEVINPPNLSNIEIIHVPEKQIHQGGAVNSLRRCLEVHLDPSCEAEMLAAILDRMADHEPSGNYSSDLLITVINQVMQLVLRPNRPPSKAEVIGAWGEIRLLLKMSQASKSPHDLQRIISCWESEGESRDIIDFRFPHIDGGLALEVKTSTSGRVHHINGLDQVTTPDGFQSGFLASLSIRETDGTSGETSASLVSSIETSFGGSEQEIASLKRTLHAKLKARGVCCYDTRFHFILPDDGLRLIDMGSVPKPTIPSDVTEVEWIADLSESQHLGTIPILG